MLKTKIFVRIVVPLLGASLAPTPALAADACELLGQQIRGLTREEAVILRNNGFVHALYLSDHLPATVISKRIIQDCPERLLAAKYFDNKISGEELFAIGKGNNKGQTTVFRDRTFQSLVKLGPLSCCLRKFEEAR